METPKPDQMSIPELLLASDDPEGAVARELAAEVQPADVDETGLLHSVEFPVEQTNLEPLFCPVEQRHFRLWIYAIYADTPDGKSMAIGAGLCIADSNKEAVAIGDDFASKSFPVSEGFQAQGAVARPLLEAELAAIEEGLQHFHELLDGQAPEADLPQG